MISELVIHLGDTKTGSTSIQRTLARDGYRTNGKSLIYPTRNNHIALAKTLTQKRRFAEREARFGRIREVLEQGGADACVVSAEHFQMVDPRVLHQAAEDYWPAVHDGLRLVAYVRPHAGKFLSTFSERIKLGADLASPEAFFDILSASPRLDYTPRFTGWRDTFGTRFTLRPFLRERLEGGDVVRDFLHYALDGGDFEITETIVANPSLTLGQLALLRRMQRRVTARVGRRPGPQFHEAQSALGRIAADRLHREGIGTDGAKLRLPAALAARFTARYAADAEALDDAFFDGFPMSDALEAAAREATEAEQPLEPEDHFDAGTIREMLDYADHLAETMENRPKQFRELAAGIGDPR